MRLPVRVLIVVVLVAGVAACSDDDDFATDNPTGAPTGESTTVPVSVEELALPVVLDAPRPTGDEPSLTVGRRLELQAPSALADPPGPGPVLVSTLDGQVHVVDLDAGTSRVVLDIADQISTGGERGLLGMAVDDAATRMYLEFTNPDGDTRIRSWALGADGLPVPGEGVLHLELAQPFANHNGGNLVWGPDGALWVGTGDGGSGGDPNEAAQDPENLLGKMLRFVPDPDGGVVAPSTNPDWGGRPEVWAIGLRNPWRYSFDRATNRLWIADVGQNLLEEVSVIDPDAARPNFGWDTVEGTDPFEGEPSPDFTPPVVTYDHDRGCSITGGYVYRGERNPGLYGWYLYADFCTGFIDAVPADDPGRDPVLLVQDVGNIISFGQLDDGELVILTYPGISRLEPGGG